MKYTVRKTLLIAFAVLILASLPLAVNHAYGTAQPPQCGDTKPGSAPSLLSAVSSGANQVTLTWSKATDPVTYYLVTFGTHPGEQLYGNPNVGGSDTTSYTVSHLSGGKNYYFKVRAGNGCKPGDYSNEVAGYASGGYLTGIPGGFAPGVLGAKTTAAPTPSEFVPSPTIVYMPPTGSPPGWLARFFGFLLRLFSR